MDRSIFIILVLLYSSIVCCCHDNTSIEPENILNTCDSQLQCISSDSNQLLDLVNKYFANEKIIPNHRIPNIYTVIFSSQGDSNFLNINGNTEIPTFFEDSGFKVPDPIGVLFIGDSPVLIFDDNKPIGKQFYSMFDLNTDTIAYIVNLYDSEMAKGFLSNVIYPHWSYTFETGSRKVVLVEKSKLQFIRTNKSQRTWILTNPELFNVELNSSYSYK